MSTILIRPIRESDVPGFHAAVHAVCREKRYLATVVSPPIEKTALFVSGNVKNGHPQFVADDAGIIVGWCDAIPGSDGRAHIGRLGMGVLKEHRGQGLGKRLLEATIDEAQRIGLEKIELSVYLSNEPAIALYRSFGFVEEGLKKRGRLVEGIYDDVVLMGLFLREGT
ncbi:GNAT family N-acetyltransferase [Haloferula sp. BvORR071]|uniref:GNAT family N-acetyltransferase n=1 Tax=Haloferula sp. BvORR071 TaxID=1396141 RepID=UPI00054F6066|nr:GNAT family N-acetyltransferase [Haloferula sp. BvORR071]